MNKLKPGTLCIYIDPNSRINEPEPIHEYINEIMLVINSNYLLNLYMCFSRKKWMDENIWTFYKKELKKLC